MDDHETGRSGSRWRPWRIAAWAIGAPLLIGALVARQFVGEGGWVDTSAQTGALLLGIGMVSEFVWRKKGRAAYRSGITLAVFAVLLLGWVNGAVGIIGSEDNPANLMYAGVVAVGVIGAVIARLRPAGMKHAMLAAALAQALVGVVAIVGGMGGVSSEPLEIVMTNGFFVTLFVGSAALFSKAARAHAVQRDPPIRGATGGP